MFRINKEENIEFTILVKTRAKKNEIIYDNEIVTIKVKAQPVKGKANKEIIKLLAKFFEINSSSINIVQGNISTTKTIEIQNCTVIYLENKLNVISDANQFK